MVNNWNYKVFWKEKCHVKQLSHFYTMSAWMQRRKRLIQTRRGLGKRHRKSATWVSLLGWTDTSQYIVWKNTSVVNAGQWPFVDHVLESSWSIAKEKSRKEQAQKAKGCTKESFILLQDTGYLNSEIHISERPWQQCERRGGTGRGGGNQLEGCGESVKLQRVREHTHRGEGQNWTAAIAQQGLS